MLRILILLLSCAAMVFAAFSSIQDDKPRLDKSRIPLEAGDTRSFVPPGWSIEEDVVGDLDGDGVPDHALQLIEDKRPAKEDVPNDRQRALVILLKNKDGKFTRAAVANTLLQCTSCGGAFYGVVEAPAHVKIEKGILVVNQDHGSRDVTETTYRFRFDPTAKRFLLIGLDVTDADRATGGTVSESTNYLTGSRITKRSRSGSGSVGTRRKHVPLKKTYIEEIDHYTFEQVAS